jgi:hypothetical protein
MNLPYLSSQTIKKLSALSLESPENFYSLAKIDELIRNNGGFHLSKYSSNEPQPELLPDDKLDAENAQKIHRWISSFKIPRAALADGRLWSALSLITFAAYTNNRWHGGDIKKRYLAIGSSQRSLIRNSISRLYWTAELTVCDGDYSRTETAFLYQDIQASLLERAFCVNKHIILNSIEHIGIEHKKNKETLNKKRIQTYARLLNNAGGTISLSEVAKVMIPDIFKQSL